MQPAKAVWNFNPAFWGVDFNGIASCEAVHFCIFVMQAGSFDCHFIVGRVYPFGPGIKRAGSPAIE